MRLHRFYIREAIGTRKKLSIPDKKLAHQLRDVFRFKTGDSFVLFDGSGHDFVSSITNLTGDRVEVALAEKRDTCYTPTANLHIFQSMVKKDNFEWILEKATEIGVSEFTPVISERTEKKTLNVERAETILIEASEQSGRCAVPILHEVSSLKEVVGKHGKDLVAFHLKGEVFDASHFKKGSEGKVLIGPEGGWSDKEVEMLKQAGVKMYSLGAQTLRAETAAMAVAALLLL